MSETPKAFNLSPEIHSYIVAHSEPQTEVERSLVAATEALGGVAIMQVAPEQGVFMALLASAIGARRVIEIGTFTGYSTLCLARALPADGLIVACDLSKEWTAIGSDHWQRAGVADKIDLRVGPALATLRSLPVDEPFDLAFIDADKTGYADYYEEILVRLRPGGIILVDNVLWMGTVVDQSVQDPDTIAIRAFNDKVVADARVECSMIAVGDGLSLLRKR
ncbi:MAG: caffeoyl-CoA O-methyltransferase [Hyphomicrobiaceae bacterium]|jgi:caffeoyl-CoA O-methyltransferase